MPIWSGVCILGTRGVDQKKMHGSTNKMDKPIPHHINERQSDIRGIKEGWYAMDKDGHVTSGPFSSREDCLKSVIQPTS